MPVVEVVGRERLAATLAAAARDLDDLAGAGRDAAARIVPRARGGAPRLTGALAGSVRADVTRVEVALSSTLTYARPVHFGSPRRNVPARPFLTDAILAREAAVVDIYGRAVDRSLSKIKGS